MKESWHRLAMAHRALAWAAVVLLLALASAGVRAETVLQQFDVAPLTLELADGTRHDFQVEIAETVPQQLQGLMFRREMAQFAGMLFVYKTEAERTMWMKNTYIPLDMVFIGKYGRVVSYRERAVPQSLATISSGVPAMAVLELNSGMISRLGIKPGDRVLYKAFGTAP